MGAALVIPFGRRSAAAKTPAAEKPVPEVKIGGLRVARLSRDELVSQMVADCLAQRGRANARPKLVFAANGHVISLAASDAEFRRHHEIADLIHADGQPVVFASKFTRAPIPERSATTDFFHDAARVGRLYGLRMYVLGGLDDVNARCVALMQATYPGLQIVGRHHGYFRPEEEASLCEEINASRADVVWVGLSVPLEQAFCVRNRDRLRAGWLVTAGGCYNYVTGDYARAPQWMQRYGLEWLHRLWREPGRLFLRYAVTNPHSLFLMLTRTASLAGNTRVRVAEDARLQHGLS